MLQRFVASALNSIVCYIWLFELLVMHLNVLYFTHARHRRNICAIEVLSNYQRNIAIDYSKPKHCKITMFGLFFLLCTLQQHLLFSFDIFTNSLGRSALYNTIDRPMKKNTSFYLLHPSLSTLQHQAGFISIPRCSIVQKHS